MKKAILGICLVVAFLLICFLLIPVKALYEKGSVVFPDGQEVSVYISDTEEKRIAGLSSFEQFSLGEGMLFVFEEEIIPSFWMKDMNFPIDIIWINKDLVVAGFEESISPNTYPRTYSPTVPVQYVLEAPASFVWGEGITIGDTIHILRNL